MKWHARPDGSIGRCLAIFKCRYTRHFDTEEEARHYEDTYNKNKIIYPHLKNSKLLNPDNHGHIRLKDFEYFEDIKDICNSDTAHIILNDRKSCEGFCSDVIERMIDEEEFTLEDTRMMIDKLPDKEMREYVLYNFRTEWGARNDGRVRMTKRFDRSRYNVYQALPKYMLEDSKDVEYTLKAFSDNVIYNEKYNIFIFDYKEPEPAFEKLIWD